MGQADPDYKCPHSQCSATQCHTHFLQGWVEKSSLCLGFWREHFDYPVKNALYDGWRAETGGPSRKVHQTLQMRKCGDSDQNGREVGGRRLPDSRWRKVYNGLCWWETEWETDISRNRDRSTEVKIIISRGKLKRGSFERRMINLVWDTLRSISITVDLPE